MGDNHGTINERHSSINGEKIKKQNIMFNELDKSYDDLDDVKKRKYGLTKDFKSSFEFDKLQNSIEKLNKDMKNDGQNDLVSDIRRTYNGLSFICDSFIFNNYIILDRFSKVFQSSDALKSAANQQGILRKFVKEVKRRKNDKFFIKKKFLKFQDTIKKFHTSSNANIGILFGFLRDFDGLFEIKFLNVVVKIYKFYLKYVSYIYGGYFLKIPIRKFKKLIDKKDDQPKKDKEIKNFDDSALVLKNKKIQIPMDEKRIFGPDGPKVSHIVQGFVGDCYLLAALQYIVARDPQKIKQIIEINFKKQQIIGHLNQVKEYKNNEYKLGRKFTITFTKWLPTFDNVVFYNKNNPIWPFCIEAFYITSQKNKMIPVESEKLKNTRIKNSDKELIVSGGGQIPMMLLTGEKFVLNINFDDKKSAEEFKEIICDESKSKFIQEVAFKRKVNVPKNLWFSYDRETRKIIPRKTQLELISEHAYTYLETVYVKGAPFCLIRNPHAINETNFPILLGGSVRGSFLLEMNFLLNNFNSYTYKNEEIKSDG